MFKTNNKKAALVSIVSIVFLFNSSSGFAAINLDHRTGTVILTTPSNELKTIESGQPLPPIESGASIEVVTGIAHIATDAGDVITLIINNEKVTLRDKGKIEVHKDLSTGRGLLKVLEGSVEIVRADGTTETLGAGQTFEAEPVAPTALDTLAPGTDPAQNVGRQKDTELGKVQGY